MVRRRRLHPLVPFFLLLGACATRPFDRSTEPGGEPLGTTTAGTYVLTGDALAGDPTLSVLDAIRRTMPQMRIVRSPDPTVCPLIDLRGRDRVFNGSNPDVYVDGQHSLDTCVLNSILAINADRVEVYPLGVTSRAGYPSTGHGLILVFLQRAGGSGE